MVFDIEGTMKMFEEKSAELKKTLSLTERISNAATALPDTSARLNEAIGNYPILGRPARRSCMSSRLQANSAKPMVRRSTNQTVRKFCSESRL